MRLAKDGAAYYLWWASVVFIVFCCGLASEKYRLFPSRVLSVAAEGYRKLRNSMFQPETSDATKFILPSARGNTAPCKVINATKSSVGLNFVTCMTSGDGLLVKVVDMDGNDIHKWDIDWFKIWSDAKHISADMIPKARPGTHVHGAFLLENGNLIFNFEHLGLACVDFDGKVVWRLPYQTHHSVTRDDQGNLWVCGQKEHVEPSARVPYWKPPFTEETILNVTPEGKILKEWSVIDLLLKNGYKGLLYLEPRENIIPTLSGDILHLNDVEPFPAQFKEGFFRKGDVMVSLRNINTIFVFNQKNDEVKFVSTGQFIRQHDPDFIDGDTFSVFDNHNVPTEKGKLRSRILLVSAPTGTVKCYYEGTPEQPFYTMIMGKHQWLTNGNLLITETGRGKAFEINRQNKIIWEYYNILDDRTKSVAIMEEVTRLPPSYTTLLTGSGRKSIEKSISTNN